MTAQEVFDKVYWHLLRQGRRSMLEHEKGEICAYRGEGGTKCAVGCLIPDDAYSPSMEGLGVHQLRRSGDNNPLTAIGLEHFYLLRSLQSVHDRDDPSIWRRQLKRVANAFSLEVPTEETCNDTTSKPV